MTRPPIRPAGAEDIAAITRIYAHAVQHGTASFEIEPPDEAEMARRWRVLVDGGYPFLVAERVAEHASDRAIAGYAYTGPYRSRPAYRWTVEDSIYIEAGMQGRGVGGALLGHLIAEAQARGFRQMIAVIGDSNQAASVALHRRAGFRLVGTFANVGFKHGRWLDSVLMQRALGAGAMSPP